MSGTEPTADEASSPTVFELSFDGHPCRIVLPDGCSDEASGWNQGERRIQDQAVLSAVRGRLQPDDLVLDIGAQFGLATLYLATAARCRIRAIEPDPRLNGALRQNVDLNHLADRIHLQGPAPGPLPPLDALAIVERVSLIRVGAAGPALEIVRGARDLLARDRPALLLRGADETDLLATAAWLADEGYSARGGDASTVWHLFEPLAQAGPAQTMALRDAEVVRLKDQVTSLRHELDQARRASTKLTRAVQVREARLNAAARREDALARRIDLQRSSVSFQIGQALVASTRSVRAAIRLPTAVWRIYRDAQRRKAADVAMPAVADGATPSPGGRTPASAPTRLDFPLASRTAPTPLARTVTSLKTLRIAAVMDEFTHHSFAPECELLPLGAAQWQSQVEAFGPDIVFIESAWKGSQGEWALKVSNPSEELAALIRWAAAQRVPTVFWNKEDPVHFGGFLHVAKAVDHVFTTDVDCVARYKREVGHDRVYLLPFAAQPAVHNPIERFPREDAFCFAGSYYLKYPERQRDFRSLLDVVKTLGPVEIFDRNFEKPHPHYEFPPEYQPYIVGSLPFDQIDKAYKGYRYGINMNTIKQSQTMFARRVFELMASNTIVVSNFSRGMRLMFGDLVVSSDSATELRRRLAPLADDRHARKFRLAGLRKVMGEHTYAHRLAYVVDKLGGGAIASMQARLCAVAFAANADDAGRLVQTWARQTATGVPLVLIGPALPEAPTGDVHRVDSARALRHCAPYLAADWILPLSLSDYHGPNYAQDLRLAVAYGPARAYGKAAHFSVVPGDPGQVALNDAELAYQPVDRLALRASMVQRQLYEAIDPTDAEHLEQATIDGEGLLSLDEFNYAMGAGPAPGDAIRAVVDDLPGLRMGLHTGGEMLPRAEQIAAASQPDVGQGLAAAPGLSAAELLAWLPADASAHQDGDRLRLDPALPMGRHRYLYLERVFTREELNFELNSRFQLICTVKGGLQVRTVFEFLDEDRRKLSHAMNTAGEAFSLPIPAACRFLRFGLRVAGTGTLWLDRLVTADLRGRPTVLVGTSPCLVVVKQYPSYDDLYRYGFVHSRLRAYRRHGTACDVFRLANDEPFQCREFENVDVTTGDRDLLDLALQSGQYRHVLVHLMDRPFWEILKRHIDRVRVTVWVHGAEIQAWQRREFEFVDLDEDEIERQKKLGEQRVAFWREVLDAPHPNLTLVFVSRHFAEEAATDIGHDLDGIRHEVIHNFIDTDVFPYVPKTAEDRLRLLSIRPYAGRKYGNDLTLKAILDLAKEPWFGDLRFTIVGDGEQFEALTSPLADLANVTLIRRFLTQAEIAELHRSHGVFLNPTRWDSQGVSRDEAMSSGLVPVTNAVAAVPEFVDDSCAMLAPADDHKGIADAIRQLRAEPGRFLALSEAAARRVRSQSSFEQTIGRELRLLQVDGVAG